MKLKKKSKILILKPLLPADKLQFTVLIKNITLEKKYLKMVFDAPFACRNESEDGLYYPVNFHHTQSVSKV